MPLPPFLRRKTPAAAPPAPEGSPEVARTRARRRLIGAVLLLGVGVIAFPLLFETEPRPIPVDLPIIVPSKEGAPPLAMPGGSGAVGTAETALAAASAGKPGLGASRPPLPMITEPPTDPAPTPAGVAAAGAASAGVTGGSPSKAAVSATAAAASAPRPTPKPSTPAASPSSPPAAAPVPVAPAPAAAATASAPASPERYVVQIGAFAEEKTVRDVRAKATKAGLETFTQVVTVEAGTRTRVRIGPFPRRQDAEAAAAKAKKAGLPASVLKL